MRRALVLGLACGLLVLSLTVTGVTSAEGGVVDDGQRTVAPGSLNNASVTADLSSILEPVVQEDDDADDGGEGEADEENEGDDDGEEEDDADDDDGDEGDEDEADDRGPPDDDEDEADEGDENPGIGPLDLPDDDGNSDEDEDDAEDNEEDEADENDEDNEDDGQSGEADEEASEAQTPTPTPTAAPSTSDEQASAAGDGDTRFVIQAATLSDTSVTTGERVEVAIRVENVGDRAGTFRENLLVDGEAVATASTTIPSGGHETVTFEHRFETAGAPDIAIGDRSLGTLTVIPTDEDRPMATRTADGDEGPIEVVGASVPADWVRQGFHTTVRATVVNTADERATRALTVTIDGRPVANTTLTLQPNERDTVPIEFDAADGTVAVEGVEAGRIDVSGNRENVTDPTADSEPVRWGIGTDLAMVLTIVGTLTGTAAVYVTRQH